MNRQKVSKFLNKLWREWRGTILFIVFVIIPVKSSLADLNWVPTGSMNPTILEGDLLCVNKAAYDLRLPLTLHRLVKWGDPERGDIVICFSPDDGTRLVKRVIGVPGDIIQMRGNVLFLNGQSAGYAKMDSQYAKYIPSELKDQSIFRMEDLDGFDHPVMSIPSVPAKRSFGPVTVPDDCYFVLGDNRDNSKDSRIFGFVQRESIVGKAVGIVGSFDITDKYQPRFGRFASRLK
jgi:signal peptidase I